METENRGQKGLIIVGQLALNHRISDLAMQSSSEKTSLGP
jgi:hypothetical protein